MYSKWQENKDERILKLIQNNPAEEDRYMDISNRADNLVTRIRQHNQETNQGGQTR